MEICFTTFVLLPLEVSEDFLDQRQRCLLLIKVLCVAILLLTTDALLFFSVYDNSAKRSNLVSFGEQHQARGSIKCFNHCWTRNSGIRQTSSS